MLGHDLCIITIGLLRGASGIIQRERNGIKLETESPYAIPAVKNYTSFIISLPRFSLYKLTAVIGLL